MRTTEGGATRVSVLISNCASEDARTVLRTLSGVFESDRPAGEPQPGAGPRPATVWPCVFDVTGPPRSAEPAVLSGTVDAELQGPPQAVDRLTDALSASFTVRRECGASGDQEKEIQLRLTSS